MSASSSSAAGGWSLQTSRSTGARYWTRGGVSWWHDAGLPAGWAWGQASATGPRFWVELATGARRDKPPPADTAAAAAAAAAAGAPPPPKRARREEEEAPAAAPAAPASAAAAATASSSSAAASSSASALASATAAAPAPVARLPRLRAENCVLGKPETRPTVPAAAAAARGAGDSPFFGEPHRLVLRQLCAALSSESAARASREAARRRAEDEDFGGGAAGGGGDREIIVFDVGSGEGAVAAFVAAALPTAEVYAIDMWHAGYYADSLREFGHAAAAAAYEARAAAAGGDGYAAFSAAFWEEPRVTPVRYPDLVGLTTLRDAGLVPALVYVDCDLHGEQLGAVLREVLRRFPGAHVAGGGWDLSPQVSLAVLAALKEAEAAAAAAAAAGGDAPFGAARSRRLHVEQGRCWTLSAEAIRTSGNSGADASAALLVAARADAAASSAREVESRANRRARRRADWLAGVLAVLAAGDDAAALRVAVGAHGRPPGGGGGAGAGAADDGDSDADAAHGCWVDVGDATKSHLTALMHACKAGRLACAEALLREHGARATVLAERSQFSALGLAAYHGHAPLVRVLLAAGADVLATNRYGESPLAVAQKAGHGAVAALLAPLTAAAASAREAAATPSPPAVAALRGGPAAGAPLALRPVAPADQAAVTALYTACQAEFITDERSRRVRTRWFELLLATDLADVAARYAAVPRAGFWVATLAPADFVRATGGTPPPPALLLPGGGGVLVACAGLKPYVDGQAADAAAAAAAATAELLRLCVLPTLRRCGAAAALTGHIEAWARRAGYSRVRLTTQTDMVAAQRLYERRGYAHAGTVTKSYHGDLISLIDYEKELGAAEAAAAGVEQ